MDQGAVDSTSEIELQALRPDTVFHGRYRVVRRLGAGGMGAVYEVVHLETRRRRALKIMLPSLLSDAEMRSRFRFEATATAEIASDHLVEIFDAGIDEATGLPFLVMELLRGESLLELLARRGGLPASEVVLLLRQASLALDRTHVAGIVHRDLKPENLFVTARDDGSPCLKLLDFGIAKVVAQGTQPNTTRNFGTPLYMSPEQIRGDGDIGPQADLYSLAQIAFTLLTGHAYWEAEAQQSSAIYALLLKIAAGTVEPASERAAHHGIALSPAFDAWFAEGTALEASARFDSASELVDELASALGVEQPRRVQPLTIEPNPAPAASGRVSTLDAIVSPRRSPLRPGALLVTLVAIAGTGLAVLAQERHRADTPGTAPVSPADPIAPSAAPPAHPPQELEPVPVKAPDEAHPLPSAGAKLATSAPKPSAKPRQPTPSRPPKGSRPRPAAADPTDIR